jgi:cobyrinic acid a,c-diamide synthase
VSKILNAPVILVANVERLNRTSAAILLGYKVFDPDVDLRGVILNRVGNPRHAARVRLAVEKLAKLKVFGVIPREKVNMPYRHLGLVPAYERDEFLRIFDFLAEFIERHVDIDRIVEIASKAKPMDTFCSEDSDDTEKNVRIGVVRDRVFSFYYQDNIDLLSSKAEITVIDSLRDKKLPEIDALYIGGGFPEVFAEELEKNRKLRNAIYDFCDGGMPVYAECGGLMYLGESIENESGEYEMVGFLPIKTKMYKKFQAQGYCIYRAEKGNLIARRNDTLVGHEFHYSRVTALQKLNFAFRVKRGYGVDGIHDGIMKKNVLANYIHLHFLSNRSIPIRFLSQVKKIKEKN